MPTQLLKWSLPGCRSRLRLRCDHELVGFVKAIMNFMFITQIDGSKDVQREGYPEFMLAHLLVGHPFADYDLCMLHDFDKPIFLPTS